MKRVMARALALCGIILMAGCGPTTSGNTGNEDPATDTTQLTDTDTVIQYFVQDRGSLMLVREFDGVNKSVSLYGLFVDDHPGFQNVAQCAVGRELCWDTLPVDEDTYVDPNPDLLWDPLYSDYRYVGLKVSLGGYEAHYFNDDQVSYYFGDLTEEVGENPIFGTMGAIFGVEWGDYSGTADLEVSTDIELQFPRPGRTVRFHDGDQVLIEWVPNGEGDIYLTVSGGLNFYRLFLLEDDGYFEVDVDDLGFGTDSMQLEFELSRWNRGQITHNGHTLDLVATSQVTFKGEYFYVGGRTEIELADTCGEALTAPITTTGGYWGRLQDWGYSDDIDVASEFACTGWFSRGEEGIFHIQLEPLQILTAEYLLVTDDASIYVLEDCTDVGTCVAGTDDVNDGQPEFLSYFNATDETIDLYLVADGYLTTKGVFYMDITIDQVLEPDMYDTCPDAMLQPAPMAAGTYYTSYLPYTNTLDPGAGGCTLSAQVGPESMTKVEVGPYQTLTLNINMTNGDPALYLLYNCTNTLSCAVGADISVGDRETLVYVNQTNSTETLYLVVDSKTFMRPYFLTVDLQ